MEFIAQTQLREVLRVDSDIRVNSVDGYNLSDFEGYKEYLRKLFSNFYKELHENFTECTDENTITYYLRQLRYNKTEWEKIKAYAKQKTEFILLDKPKIVNNSNVLSIKEFLREKERYCTKAINKINTQIKELESDISFGPTNSIKSKKKTAIVRSTRLTFGFQWNRKLDIANRAYFLKKLKELKLIDGNADTIYLKNVFYFEPREKIAIETWIRWIVKSEKSPLYHKGALVYMINELERNGIIEPIGDLRLKYKKIRQFFADDAGNEIKKLNTVKLPTNGKNKTIIDNLIVSLIK